MTSTIRWARERFYWALLESPPYRGELPPGLVSALEDEVPEADLHAVCSPAADGRVLVCALPRSLLAQIPSDALALSPESVPDFSTSDPDELNLLVGRMEPRAIRRARAQRHGIALAAVAFAVLLACVGLARRAAHWQSAAQSLTAARDRLMASASPSGSDLVVELTRRRRSAASDSIPRFDAAADLSAFLANWPAGTPSKPLSITVHDAGIQLAVCTEGDPTPFITALHPPKGWVVDEPRLNTAGTLTRVNLQLHAAGRGTRD